MHASRLLAAAQFKLSSTVASWTSSGVVDDAAALAVQPILDVRRYFGFEYTLPAAQCRFTWSSTAAGALLPRELAASHRRESGLYPFHTYAVRAAVLCGSSTNVFRSADGCGSELDVGPFSPTQSNPIQSGCPRLTSNPIHKISGIKIELVNKVPLNIL